MSVRAKLVGLESRPPGAFAVNGYGSLGGEEVNGELAG